MNLPCRACGESHEIVNPALTCRPGESHEIVNRQLSEPLATLAACAFKVQSLSSRDGLIG